MLIMGLPNHRTDQSSESDEDNYVRHDRFKSERYPKDSSQQSSKYNDKYSRNYRDRSPNRHGSLNSSTSSKNEPRQRYKYLKSNRFVDSETSVHHKRSCVSETDRAQTPKVRKNNLSAILKNFDKKIESKRNNSLVSVEIGPALPPHLNNTEFDMATISNDTISNIGIGPALPPEQSNIQENANIELKHKPDSPFQNENELLLVSDKETSNENNKVVEVHDTTKVCYDETIEQEFPGPRLPLKPEPETYVPTLPAKLEQDSYGPAVPTSQETNSIQGPVLPLEIASKLGQTTQESSEDEEDMVGPQLEGKISKAQYLLDMRATQIKRKLDEEKCGASKRIEKREEWMLELPPEKAANLGLGPRSFRMREAPDMSNRSSWTDTPAEKLRKEQQALKGEIEVESSEEVTRKAFIKERDNVMDKMLQKAKKEDQPQSLLELHQKELKKKKRKEEKGGKKKERRPFDRNIDLQVNRFDDAQKKAIFKKAQMLNSRFSSGESKYL